MVKLVTWWISEKECWGKCMSRTFNLKDIIGFINSCSRKKGNCRTRYIKLSEWVSRVECSRAEFLLLGCVHDCMWVINIKWKVLMRKLAVKFNKKRASDESDFWLFSECRADTVSTVSEGGLNGSRKIYRGRGGEHKNRRVNNFLARVIYFAQLWLSFESRTKVERKTKNAEKHSALLPSQ